MDFLQLKDKKILIFGVANRKSVAFHIAQVLQEAGAKLLFSVLGPEPQAVVEKHFPGCPVNCCDVSDDDALQAQAEAFSAHQPIYGIVHSIAFANFSDGLKPFHATGRDDFLQAMDISCYSFIRIADLYKPFMDLGGALLTVSISTTKMAAANYGYMAPIKAALDSSMVFLAKSLSEDSRIRVNAVGASLLKTSASAAILVVEMETVRRAPPTLRKEALKTEEVANVAAFLLSSRASGINAQTVIIDAGMSVNYFDENIVKKISK